jgi:hypothetical protein
MKKLISAIFICLTLGGTANAIDTWPAPETISAMGVNSSNPKLEVDESGNSVAIWLEETKLVAKTKLFGESWSSATSLVASGASEPKLAVNADGDAVAVWVESGVVNAARKPFGMSWGSTTTLSGASSTQPAVAIDPSGDIVAVWSQSGVIKSKTCLSGTWSSPEDTLSGANSTQPQVAVGSDGTVIAIWQSLNGVTSLYNINSAKKTISGSWGSATTASNTSYNSVYPQIAVDSEGNSIAIWFRYKLTGAAYSDVILQSSYLASAGTWSTPVDLLASDESFVYGNRDPATFISKIGFNPNNHALVVWTDSFVASKFALFSAQSLDGMNWRSFNVIQNDLYILSADININAIGDGSCAYMAQDLSDDLIKIYYIETDVGSFGSDFWSSPQLISSSGQSAYPVLGTSLVGPTGTLGQVAWVNYDGTNNIIQTTTGSGTIVLPPSNVSASQSSQDFGVFTEYVNTITWTASTDPDVLSYVVYRNGQFLASLSDTEVSYVDNNQTQNGTVTYGVSAFDNVGDQSQIVTFTLFP